MAGLTQTYATQVIADLRLIRSTSAKYERACRALAEGIELAQHFTLAIEDETAKRFLEVGQDSTLAGHLPYDSMTLSGSKYLFLLSKGRMPQLFIFHRKEISGRSTWAPLNYTMGVDTDTGYFRFSYLDRDISSLSPDEESVLQADFIHALARFAVLVGALSCTNVRAETYHPAPPAKVNEKRAREGKPPLFETKTLTIHVNPRAPGAHLNSGGGHASPRQHLRRGHIRRLPSGQNTWVQPCVVGDASKGFVGKTYKVVA